MPLFPLGRHLNTHLANFLLLAKTALDYQNFCVWPVSRLRPSGDINLLHVYAVTAQLLSHVWLFLTPWAAACQASLSITISWSLLKLMLIESVMSSNHLILCCPLLLLPSILPSIRVFSNESVLCIRWPKIQTLFKWLYNCGTSKSIWPLDTSIQDTPSF